MLLKSEIQIINTWEGERSKPLVSICCTTFNQECYIEEAIDSFLMQETTFPFEIVIHDDASTDNTANILRQYKEKYPNIIRLIIQSENQYQKGVRVMPIAVSNAIGEYVALCEGDDYWVSPIKLQSQVALMLEYRDINLSFHPALANINGECSLILNKYSQRVKVFSVENLIRNGGGFCPTSSLLIKRDVFSNMPEWFNCAPAGDTYFQVMGASKGGALYLPQVMSCYRTKAKGSVSEAAKKYTLEEVVRYLDKDDIAMIGLDKYFEGKYTNSVAYRRAEFCRNFSSSFLYRGLYQDFQCLIERSWGIKPNINKVQLLMYMLRKAPRLLIIIYKLNSNLRSAFIKRNVS